MDLFDTQTQDCFLFLLDDEDDAGIVEKITDLLSSEEKQWPKKNWNQELQTLQDPIFLCTKTTESKT
jgi:hypothetical protein